MMPFVSVGVLLLAILPISIYILPRQLSQGKHDQCSGKGRSCFDNVFKVSMFNHWDDLDLVATTFSRLERPMFGAILAVFGTCLSEQGDNLNVRAANFPNVNITTATQLAE